MTDKLDAAGVRGLYNAVDFVGISAYPRFKGRMTEMEDSTQMFDQELKVGCRKGRLLRQGGRVCPGYSRG